MFKHPVLYLFSSKFLIEMFTKVVDPSKTPKMFWIEIALHVISITYRTLFSSSLYSDDLV